MAFRAISRSTCVLALLLALGSGWTVAASERIVRERSRPGSGVRTGRPGQATGQPGKPAPGQPAAEQVPEVIPGEVVVRLAPGGRLAAVTDTGLQVKQKLLFAPNTYVLEGVQGPPEAAAAQIQQIPGVQIATPNRQLKFHTFPQVASNDPSLPDQWALQQMGARSAWGVTVGERFTNGPRPNVLHSINGTDFVVGVIDIGVQLTHPDLAAHAVPGASFDFIRGIPLNENIATEILSPFGTHGTNVTGCVTPLTNNSEGIAGFPWEGVKFVSCHVGRPIGVPPVVFVIVDIAAVVDAIYYCISLEVDVINMSLGGPFPDPLLHQAVTDAYFEGVVVVASSGNSRFGGISPGVSFPAAFEFAPGGTVRIPALVIAVGATARNGALASYSDGGPELDLVAPGGDFTGFGGPGGLGPVTTIITSTSDPPSTYTGVTGTSFSSPYVAGSIATLMSQGAVEVVDEMILQGVLPKNARVDSIYNLLISTTTNTLPGRAHDDDFGFGVLNVDAALRNVTQTVDITGLIQSEGTTASFAEIFEAVVTRPAVAPPDPLDFGDFEVTQASGLDLVPANVTGLVNVQNINPLNPHVSLLTYEPDAATRWSIGINRLNVIVQSTLFPFDGERSLEGPPIVIPAEGVNIPERAFRFSVQPPNAFPGLKTFSLPFELQAGSNTISFVFGGTPARVARWNSEQQSYSIFGPMDTWETASADANVTNPPVGVGFWVDPDVISQLNILGHQVRGGVYRVPLDPGWNLVGDPFTAAVTWSVIGVEFNGRTAVTVGEAARQGLIQSGIFRWDGTRYILSVWPQGELRPFEAVWVFAHQPITLVIPRAGSVGAGTSLATSGARPGTQAARGSARGGQAAGRAKNPPTAPRVGARRASGPGAKPSRHLPEARRQASAGAGPNRAARPHERQETYRARRAVKTSRERWPGGWSKARLRSTG
jgi:subtilisin family serine protease